MLTGLATSLLANPAAAFDGVLDRWASSARGAVASAYGTNATIIDLTTGVITRLTLPDTCEARSEWAYYPNVTSDSGLVSFEVVRPQPGVLSLNLSTGQTARIDTWERVACALTEAAPRLTVSGDTVLGSLSYVRWDDYAFDIDPVSGVLSRFTNYHVEAWYPGLACNGESGSLPERLEQTAAARYDWDGSRGHILSDAWWETARLDQGRDDEPVFVGNSGYVFEFHPRVQGQLAVCIGKCCPRRLLIYRNHDGLIDAPELADNSQGIVSADISPDQLSVVAAEEGYSPRIFRILGPDFKQVATVCQLDQVRVHMIRWTRDLNWVIALGSTLPVDCGGDESVCYAIELATGEFTRITLDAGR